MRLKSVSAETGRKISDALAVGLLAWLLLGWLPAIIVGTSGAPEVGAGIGLTWIFSFLVLMVVVGDD